MKNSKKIVALLGAVTLMAAALTGCGSAAADTTTAPAETTAAADTAAEAPAETPAADTAEAGTDITGTVTMSGSTSMEKLANAAAEVFMETYPNITVTAEFTGSGAGIEAVTAGTVDIGNSSRALKDEEKANGVVENIVAIDGIAMVVDPANTVADLTKDQIAAIYTGTTTNWSELGGADEPIVVVGRESGSGTRSGFEEIVGVADACKYANELDSTGAVMAKVASTPGAIGYVSLDAVDDTVAMVTVEGVEANADNIKAGTYILSRPFVMATNGEVSAQSEATQAFFNWLSSDAGKEVVAGVGLITVD